MPFKYKSLGPKPRASRAKPKKVRTCPICAELFKANRSDQLFCSTTCRVSNHTGEIAKATREKAEALRSERTARVVANKVKREQRKIEAEALRIEKEAAEQDRLVEQGRKADRVLAIMKEQGLI